ncbi:hypothetical protein E1A91_A10G084600v1 [Gossypium mustelinum]|uniref:Uncharacterized protein n=1 Tax=Gossypium mustelinum TaxID=34275 RepID=A0A5D2XJ04_GOSMU|nr:hypothetical protein E1A91_A10G084600v1 [Gossypium mustelinum]
MKTSLLILLLKLLKPILKQLLCLSAIMAYMYGKTHGLVLKLSVLDSLAVELKAAKDFSKLYAGIAILWLHLSLNQPSVVYCFFFFSDLFPLINER